MKNFFKWLALLLAEKAILDNLPSFKINRRIIQFAPRAYVIKHNKSVAKFVFWADFVYVNSMIFSLILFWMIIAIVLNNSHNSLALPLFSMISIVISFAISYLLYLLKKG